MTPARLVPLVALLAMTTGASGCLPLPGDLPFELCPTDPAPAVPANQSTADVAILERLLAWPTRLSVAASPVVTVQLPASGHDEAATLRREFGSTIDIHLGNKRLGGGPSGNPEACLITAPRWAIAPPAPRGVDVEVTPAPGGFDRHQTVEATLRVTNRTERSIRVQGYVPGGCGTTLMPALSRPGLAFAANVSEGAQSTDDHGQRPRRTFGNLSAGYDGGPPIVVISLLGCITFRPQPIETVRPGRSVDVHVTTTAVSAMAGDDPFLAPGSYDLRALVNVSTSTSAAVPLVAVAAPPTRVELHD